MWTVEGVATGGQLHPVQRAMVERGGSQCGYCTPGFVVSLFCEYYRPGRTSFDPEAIGGNLCRCTGYRPIADAARALPELDAGDPRDPPDPIVSALRAPCAPLSATTHHRARQRFDRPASVPELLACLAADPGATLIAGGTDLMVKRNLAGARFDHLVSLEAVEELRRFAWGSDEIVIGAALPLAALEDRLREHPGELPLFERLLGLFSSRLIRHRATLGGNLATASPIGDSLPVLLALDADVTLLSGRGARRLPVRELFTGYRTTALAPGELIASVHVPRPLAPVQRFYKVSKRELDDISTVAAAFAFELDGQGRIARFRAAYGGVAATPIRAEAIEREAQGRPFDRATLARMVAASATVATPLSDHRGSAAYRRAMIGRLLEKLHFETAGTAGSASAPAQTAGTGAQP
jgi:xanthine dehydrogenase small subunit